MDGRDGLCAVDDADVLEFEPDRLIASAPAQVVRLDVIAQHRDAVVEVPEVLRLLEQGVLDPGVDPGQPERLADVLLVQGVAVFGYQPAMSRTATVPCHASKGVSRRSQLRMVAVTSTGSGATS